MLKFYSGIFKFGRFYSTTHKLTPGIYHNIKARPTPPTLPNSECICHSDSYFPVCEKNIKSAEDIDWKKLTKDMVHGSFPTRGSNGDKSLILVLLPDYYVNSK